MFIHLLDSVYSEDAAHSECNYKCEGRGLKISYVCVQCAHIFPAKGWWKYWQTICVYVLYLFWAGVMLPSVFSSPWPFFIMTRRLLFFFYRWLNVVYKFVLSVYTNVSEWSEHREEIVEYFEGPWSGNMSNKHVSNMSQAKMRRWAPQLCACVSVMEYYMAPCLRSGNLIKLLKLN